MPQEFFVKEPSLCPREGNVFTIRIDNPEKLVNTVLHQIARPEEIPVFKIGGARVKLPPIEVFGLIPQDLWDGEGHKVGTVVELPDSLRALDTLLGNVKAGRLSEGQRDRALSLVLGGMKAHVYELTHPRVKTPGLMGFALGADSQLGEKEIAISSRQAGRLIAKLFRTGDRGGLLEYLLTRVEPFLALAGRDLSSRLRSGARPSEEDRKVIRQIALGLDGVAVFGVRYPNASSTSHELKTLRIYKGAPGDYIYISPVALVRRHQGDCDGDRLGIHFVPRVVDGVTKSPHPLIWRREYQSAHSAFNLDDLVVPEGKSDLEIMAGFSERGRWVGMLTYNFWLLFLALSNHWRELGMEAPDKLCPVVLDLFTPLVEGVMNARKGQGAGTIDGESLAAQVCEMFAGQRDMDRVLARLPMKEDESEYDEEKFSKSQLRFLRRGLLLVSGGNQRVRLNAANAACSDPVRLAFALRFKERAMKMLINQIGERSLSETILNSLLVQGKLPWKAGRTLTFADVNGTSADFISAEEEF